MSADGGLLGWRFGSLDIILKVDHLRTIHAMFALNWLTDFRGIFFPEFNIRLYDKNSESHYFFFPPIKSEYFFQQHWESEYFFRKKP